MRNEIERLESFLQIDNALKSLRVIEEKHVDPVLPEDLTLPKGYIGYMVFINLAREEVDKTRKAISETTFKMSTDEQVRVYINQIMTRLNLLIELHLPEYLKNSKKELTECANIQNYLRAGMEEVIRFRDELNKVYKNQLKNQLNTDLYIGKEVNNDLNNKNELKTELNNEFKSNKNDDLINKKEIKKLKTKLTVTQLALFFKLLKDEGIIEGSSQTEIEHFIANNFSSKRQEGISQKSIHNKLLDITDKDRKIVSDLMLRLYNNAYKK